MFKTLLVEKSIEDGEKLISRLEEKNIPITAAFWRYLDEAERYRLVIVSPLVHEEGPIATYRRVNEAVDDLGDSVRFGINDISVMSPCGSQFRDLRRSIEEPLRWVGTGVRPMTHQWLGLSDLYLYRWNPDPI